MPAQAAADAAVHAAESPEIFYLQLRLVEPHVTEHQVLLSNCQPQAAQVTTTRP